MLLHVFNFKNRGALRTVKRRSSRFRLTVFVRFNVIQVCTDANGTQGRTGIRGNARARHRAYLHDVIKYHHGPILGIPSKDVQVRGAVAHHTNVINLYRCRTNWVVGRDHNDPVCTALSLISCFRMVPSTAHGEWQDFGRDGQKRMGT